MRPIAHFFSENVGGIAFTVDVQDSNRAILDPLAGSIFAVFNVAVALRSQVVAPFDACLVVLIKGGSRVSVVDRVTKRLEVKNHIP